MIQLLVVVLLVVVVVVVGRLVVEQVTLSRIDELLAGSDLKKVSFSSALDQQSSELWISYPYVY